jgi:hypothetical protein
MGDHHFDHITKNPKKNPGLDSLSDGAHGVSKLRFE